MTPIKIYGQNELKSNIKMMSHQGLFDKKRLKAAATDISFAKKKNVKAHEFVFLISYYFLLIKRRTGYLLDEGNISGSKITLTFETIFSLFCFYFNVSFDF